MLDLQKMSKEELITIIDDVRGVIKKALDDGNDDDLSLDLIDILQIEQ